MDQPTGVWTVREAMRAGWEFVTPREEAGFDRSLVLMRHKKDLAHWELGWARDTEDR